MASFSAPNIVRLVGYVTKSDPVMIILEYLPGGNLQAVLQQGLFPVEHALGCIIDIARGLEYLHSKSFVHLDIACRNILVAERGFKISDFGMSHVLRNRDYYRTESQKKIPVR